MSWTPSLDILRRPPSGRPIRDVEQEILDELQFHIEMRTLDNQNAGMVADEARQNAIERFGDFERIHKKCRQTLLGERIMLQRIQAVLTVALLGAVVFLGMEFYRGQRANEAATARMMEMLGKVTTSTTQPAMSDSPQFQVLEPSILAELFPNDVKLTDVQRGFRDWSEGTFPALDIAWWQKQQFSPTQVANWEEKWLKQLTSASEKQREIAIRCLAITGCKKALPEILKIATERVEKDNADRCEAVRALGILGDVSLVPELVPLTYHYNTNTRLWAQIALVRLTGENFGRDVAAWKAWWEKQDGKPPISEELVVWAKSPWMLSMLHGAEDPKKQDVIDRQFVKQNYTAQINRQAKPTHSIPPSVVQTVPKSGDRNVDPSLTEIRVTYNKEMQDHSWSWCTGGDPTSIYPETTGDPHYEADHKTCVLPVKLKPGQTYMVVLNAGQYRAFMDTTGQPAVSYVLQFTTRKEGTSASGKKPQPSPIPSGDNPGNGFNANDQIALPVVEVPPEDLKYRTADSDEDAKALIARVLKANRPWIEPKPVTANYSLIREAAEKKEKNGPFAIQKGCRPAVRVGSIVWTPLHSMASKDTDYKLHMVGNCEWKGKTLVVVDVLFDPPSRGEIGLGGQTGTSYSYASYTTAKTRLMIDPVRAVPLFIECWTYFPPGDARRSQGVWALNADFFEIDGGFAPKMFDWVEPTAFCERQEFQVMDGVWIFKQGDAWLGAENPSGKSGHIQRLKLVDLQIANKK